MNIHFLWHRVKPYYGSLAPPLFTPMPPDSRQAAACIPYMCAADVMCLHLSIYIRRYTERFAAVHNTLRHFICTERRECCSVTPKWEKHPTKDLRASHFISIFVDKAATRQLLSEKTHTN